ncbi:SDR family oxidoreductase [Paenibacillus sp. KQZ6P-2]|uniref:SDR family oxidoreductase n=1 Tax=Paenibacillus mangrovi TaxID=2931978 RepID=A0A9X2B3G4_9BACL|nr:SDR family NAD(P)-dependent oxidoreductase [Paenibacillus mangrovi]MCJ8013589.1 SDR family oxidoreductase [Paenibacillus mangrovi]
MAKTALITGATRGIGRSIALQLGTSGYQVVVNGTKQALIDEVVSEIRQTGGVATGYCANVSDPSAVTRMVDAVIAKYGCIDVLIHNAGNLHDQKCLRMTDEEWQSVLDVHLNGAFYCIQRVLPYFPERGGDILLMTSTAGLSGSVGQVNYSAAKAGMLGMVWTLAAELQRNQIRVNAISPAALTDMTRPVIEHLQQKYASRNEPFPDFWQVGEADDVARFVVALLAQPDKDLTGEIFGVNGTKVTRWQKPTPAFSANGPEAFFAAWNQQRGRN